MPVFYLLSCNYKAAARPVKGKPLRAQQCCHWPHAGPQPDNAATAGKTGPRHWHESADSFLLTINGKSLTVFEK
jgi:hypothetical protein